MRRRRLAASAVCAALLPVACAAGSKPAASPSSWLTPLLTTVRTRGDAPGVVGLLRNGRTVTTSALGYANLKRRTRMPKAARFRAASVTKTFTAAVVLRLVADGKLSLDDTVEQWLPRSVPEASKITIRQLLNHTSGLFNYTRDPTVRATWGTDRVPSPRELVRIAASHGLDFAPGSAWEYSNTNYQLLGLIVERVTGRALADEVERVIVAPLHLSSTALDPSRDIRGRHVSGYYVYANRPAVDETRTTLGGWADGGLVSSVQDIGRFYRALFRGQLLPPQQLAELKTTVATGGFPDGDGAGFGIFRAQLRCGPAWTNSGGTAGFLTKVIVSDDGNRVVVIATNGLRDDGTQTQQAIDAAGQAAFCHGRGAKAGTASKPAPKAPVSELRGRIAYTRQTDLWVVDGTGKHRRRLTHTAEPIEYDPSWSPDGTRIVFSSSSKHDNVTDPQQVGLDRLLVVSLRGAAARVVNPPSGGLAPRWSPDGRWILFSGVEAPDDRDTGLFAMHPDGSGVRRVAERGDTGAWSRDSREVAFDRRTGGGSYELEVVDVESGRARTIATDTAPFLPVGWSPDGASILFTRPVGDHYKMFTVRRDGTGERQVLTTSITTSPDVWLPNGKIVYAEYKHHERFPHWYWVNADGTGRRALPQLYGAAEPVAWWWPK